MLRYSASALVQQGSGGGSYTSYTGTGFLESIVAGICVGTEQGEYDPTGQLASVYDQSGTATWSPSYALDAWANDNGNPIIGGGGYAPPPSYPFTSAGGYRDPATGYASDPNGGMGGAYDPRIGEDVEDDFPVDENGRDRIHAPFRAKIHQLAGHGQGVLEFAANMLPPTNVITALTGRDGATGECVSVGGRMMAGFNLLPEGLIVKGFQKASTLAKAAKITRRTHLHHLFPPGSGLAEHWADLAIDIDKYTVQVERDFHLNWLHGTRRPEGHWGPNGKGGWWNQTWLDYFAGKPNATREEVWAKMEEMRRYWGIDDLEFKQYYRWWLNIRPRS